MLSAFCIQTQLISIALPLHNDLHLCSVRRAVILLSNKHRRTYINTAISKQTDPSVSIKRFHFQVWCSVFLHSVFCFQHGMFGIQLNKNHGHYSGYSVQRRSQEDTQCGSTEGPLYGDASFSLLHSWVRWVWQILSAHICRSVRSIKM